MGLCLNLGGSLTTVPLFEVGFATNFEQFTQRLQGWQRQEIPWATKLTLDDLAYEVIAAEQAEMRRVFDNPRPWTLNGMKVRQADKYGRMAQVYWQEGAQTEAGRYLVPQVMGGPRQHTPFEFRLIRSGHLNEGEFLVPGKYAERDRRGDLNAGQVTKILSDLGGLSGLADKSQNFRNKGKRRAETYVLIKSGRMPPGIYLEQARYFKLVFAIVRQPRYRAIFRFREVAQQVMNERAAQIFRQRLGQAIATSRNNPLFLRKVA